MDEAFCRRLQIKCFMGRLDPKKRLEIILKIQRIELNKRICLIKETQYDLLKKLTTNFSGSDQFCSFYSVIKL